MYGVTLTHTVMHIEMQQNFSFLQPVESEDLPIGGVEALPGQSPSCYLKLIAKQKEIFICFLCLVQDAW